MANNQTPHNSKSGTNNVSAEHLRLIADTVPQIIWITDAQGRVEFVNQQWKDYTGGLEDPITAIEALISFVHPDDVAPILETFNRALQAGDSFRAEHRIRSAAGTYRWFLIQAEPYVEGQSGVITRWFGTLVDIHDLKVAEAALRVSEAKYRSLFNSMDDGFCILQVIFDQADQPIDCRYLETNPAFEQKSGLTNALGRTIRELVPNIEPFWFDIYGRVALTGDPMRYEDYSQSIGRWFDINAFRIGEPHERRVAVLFSDITHRKQTEAQLYDAAQIDSFRVALSDAVRVLNDPIAVQATACRLLGLELGVSRVYYYEYDEETSAGVVHHDYVKGGEASIAGAYSFEDFPSVHTLLRQGDTLSITDIANAPELTAAERSRFKAMGFSALACVPLVKHEKLVAVFVVSQTSLRFWTALEIALMEETAERTWAAVERAQAEATVAANLKDTQLLRDLSARLTSEANIQVLYDEILAAATALMRADSGTLQILDEAAQELVLLSTQGFSPAMIKHLDRVGAHSNISCSVALAYGHRSIVDFNVPEDNDSDGFLRLHLEAGFCSAQSTPLISRSGKLIGMVSTHWHSHHRPTQRELRFLDLLVRQAADFIEQRLVETERKQLLEREQTARENAERANRAKDEFLAILSHELRSPLNPILGWAKLLQMRTFNAEKTQQALAIIERNAQLQTQLIDDLLDVAKILRGKLEIKDISINLASVIEAALEVVRTAIQAKSIEVQTTLAKDCLVTGDDARLQQVIWNLLSNAIKFTPQGGRINICLESVNDCAQITIADTGKGISPDFLPQLFDSFRQEDVSITRQYGGLGLGLSIVKYLVEAHGGSVTAASPGEGLGATFTLRLPLVSGAAARAVAVPPPAPEIDLAGVKVLTVDDSQDTRELVVMLLERYGGEVRAAASGHEVLAQLSSFAPHVLVCDIGMPAMDGYTLLQHIRRLSPDQGGQVPAIAVTAYAREHDQRRALASGFQRHITKPIDPSTLLRCIADLVRAVPQRQPTQP